MRPVGQVAALEGGFKLVAVSSSNRISAVRSWWIGAKTHATWSQRRDLIAVTIISLFTIVGAWPLVAGHTVLGQDSLTFHFTAYAYLGERLSDFSIPVWNPYWFGGAPFAADPESGWTYLPAMILFSLLNVPLAIDTFLLLHLLIAGLGAYTLARILGMGVGAATVAAAAYEFTGVMYNRLPCCPAYYQVAAWVPVMLIGAELALRSETWRRRLGWWALAGFSLSQIFSVWLGQGAVYACLLLAAYLCYRTLLDPADSVSTLSQRTVNLLLHGGSILALGLGLGAAALLPRLEFHARSNLADGYVGNLSWAANLGGWDLETASTALLSGSLYDVGGVTAALAFMGLLIAGRHYAAPFFGILSVAILALSTNTVTRWSEAFPVFGDLHPHYPERITMIGAIGPAMLAGAAIAAAPRRRRTVVSAAAASSLVLLWLLMRKQLEIEKIDLVRMVATVAAIIAVVALLRFAPLRPAVIALVLVLLFGDLFFAAKWFRLDAPYGGYQTIAIEEYASANGAARFLQSRTGDEQGRFYGYDPDLRLGPEERPLYYRYHWGDPEAHAIMANNRGTLLGIEDVQGYNPLQLQRYVDFIDAINGAPQDYHGANVLQSGIDSPLLELLGARYVVIPAEPDASRADLTWLREQFPEVYRDDEVAILENRDALPRAWLVHDAHEVEPDQALEPLQDGSVNARETAVVEESPPPLAPALAGSAEYVTILDESPEGLRIRVRANAPALLIVSVNNYPSWHATVDGQSAKIYAANHIQSAIAIPPGDHVVELGHRSRSLQIGLAITSLTAGGIGGTILISSLLVAVRGRMPIPARRRRLTSALPAD
ncbi:MAG: hypothetical protein ACRDJH_26830 [Thermomicrobiales bacterium]